VVHSMVHAVIIERAVYSPLKLECTRQCTSHCTLYCSHDGSCTMSGPMSARKIRHVELDGQGSGHGSGHGTCCSHDGAVGQTQVLSDGQYLGLSVGLSGVHVRGLAPPCEQHINKHADISAYKANTVLGYQLQIRDNHYIISVAVRRG
jgi:hypothetical protein